jgi:hypothetical protein
MASMAQTLLGAMGATRIAEDIERLKDCTTRKAEAEATGSEADAQKKLAQAAAEANKAIMGNLQIRSKRAEERDKRKAKAKAMQLLEEKVSRLRQRGGQLFLDKKNLKRLRSVQPTPRPGQEGVKIRDLELSVRARRGLERMNIHDVGDLIEHTEIELRTSEGFGETSLNEIKSILKTMGRQLRLP